MRAYSNDEGSSSKERRRGHFRDPQAPRLRGSHRTAMIGRMQRLIAIMVAGAVATTSVAAAESCPTMRALALKRCCCPPSPQEHARLTCCTAKTSNDSTAAARDRHPQSHVIGAVATASWSFVSLVPELFSPVPTNALVASTAGPPRVALRI